MSKKTMIEVSDVTMQFRLNNDKILSLKEFVTTALRGKLQYNKFTALEHISFELKRGQTLGLIGRNGAGKSTLLKIISGILKPTEGCVSCYGRSFSRESMMRLWSSPNWDSLLKFRFGIIPLACLPVWLFLLQQ